MLVLLSFFDIIDNMEAYFEYEREHNLKFDIVSPCCIIGAHFHSNLEVFLVKKGKYKITKNGVTETISAGEIAVFDSYDVHSYDQRIEKENEDSAIIIPHRYLEKFNSLRQNKHIKTFIIKDEQLLNRLYSFTEEWLKNSSQEHVTFAGAQMFLALLYNSLEFENATFSDGQAIRKILSFIHQNFNQGITAKDVSNSLGYSLAYVSRLFHKYLKESIPRYLNDLRLNYVKNELEKSSDKKISQIILDAGFKSIQSYYRNKERKEKGE